MDAKALFLLLPISQASKSLAFQLIQEAYEYLSDPEPGLLACACSKTKDTRNQEDEAS